MSAHLHTPGPVEVEEVTGGYHLKAASVGKGHYAGIGLATQRNPHPKHGGGIDDATAKANALLWAAAPDLWASAISLASIPTRDCPWGCDAAHSERCPVTTARAAIAKARGL